MNKKLLIKILLILSEVLAGGLLLYLFFLPIYPVIRYKVALSNPEKTEAKDLEKAKADIETEYKALPESEYSVSANRLIIKKIGVNAPIVESASAENGLAKGAWRVPETATPDKSGNTVITGHRFKYLPPNNLTFYLLDKLEIGDIASVIWEEKNYFYRIKEIKIVPDTELSILAPSDKSILTLFTCHPIYSTEKRLVVIGELIIE